MQLTINFQGKEPLHNARVIFELLWWYSMQTYLPLLRYNDLYSMTCERMCAV